MQQKLGMTFIYITHDQEEALNMSSRIVILRDGRVEQIGTPEDVYEYPQTLFSAGFIGQSNLLHGTVAETGDDGHLTLAVGELRLPALSREADAFHTGDRAVLCLRPQRVNYGHEPQNGMSLLGTICSKEYTGGMQHTRIALPGGLTLSAVSQTAELDKYSLGETVHVGWDPRHAPLVPGGGEGDL
jgi:spermidine/putrescine transport system ATP-binding protein